MIGTGTAPNPTGGGAIVRTATANVNVTPGAPLALRYQFFMQDPNAPCSSFSNSGGANISVYIASCMDVTGAARMVEPASPGKTLDIYVGRILSTANNGTTIGGSPSDGIAGDATPWPIRSATTPSGCRYSGGPLTGLRRRDQDLREHVLDHGRPARERMACRRGDDLRQGQLVDGRAASRDVFDGSDPFDNDGVRNSSLAALFRPLGLAFDCTATDSSGNFVGSLAWNSGTHALAVNGIVFFDTAELSMQGGTEWGLYSGSGTIYINGWLNFANSGTICGPGPEASTTIGCPGEHWDPAQGELLFWALNSASVVPAVNIGGNSFYEGGAVADSQSATYARFVTSNGAHIRGPAIGDYGTLTGDGQAKSFAISPPGARGENFALGTPNNYAGG